MGDHVLGQMVFLVGQAELGLGGRDLLAGERGTVGRFAAFKGGAALGHGRVADDQGRLGGFGLAGRDGGADLVMVVAVDLDDLPVHALEQSLVIDRVHAAGRSGQLDLVAVVVDDELAQAPLSEQGRAAQADGFLDVAVRGQDIGVMTSCFRIQIGAQECLGHGHAAGHGETLAQWAGGGLHAVGHVVLGMARRLAAELPEGLQIVDGQGAAQSQQRIEQGGLVPGGEHEAVTVEPFRVVRIEVQEVLEQDVGIIGRGHGPARMSGVGGANRVHDQSLDDMDCFSVKNIGSGGHDSSRAIL